MEQKFDLRFKHERCSKLKEKTIYIGGFVNLLSKIK